MCTALEPITPKVSPMRHRFAGEHPAVDAAHGGEFEQAALLHPGDDQPHLVHVGRKEERMGGGLSPFFEGEDVAERVHLVDAFPLDHFEDFIPHRAPRSRTRREGRSIWQGSHRASPDTSKRVRHIGGDQFGGRLHVGDVDDLDRRVHIPLGDRDKRAAHPRARNGDAVDVGARCSRS